MDTEPGRFDALAVVQEQRENVRAQRADPFQDVLRFLNALVDAHLTQHFEQRTFGDGNRHAIRLFWERLQSHACRQIGGKWGPRGVAGGKTFREPIGQAQVAVSPKPVSAVELIDPPLVEMADPPWPTCFL